MARGVSNGGCVLRKSLGSQSVDGWGCVPTMVVVWPKVSQHQSLQALGWGQVLVPKTGSFQERSHRLTVPSISATSVCVPMLSPKSPRLPLGDPPRPAGGLAQGFYKVTAFALALGVHKTLGKPSKSGVAVYPSPVGPCAQACSVAFITTCSGHAS